MSAVIANPPTWKKITPSQKALGQAKQCFLFADEAILINKELSSRKFQWIWKAKGRKSHLNRLLLTVAQLTQTTQKVRQKTACWRSQSYIKKMSLLFLWTVTYHQINLWHFWLIFGWHLLLWISYHSINCPPPKAKYTSIFICALWWRTLFNLL